MRTVVATNIEVTEADNGSCSVLKIKTADRPGLLVDIVRVLKDVNLNVVSAEVDTIGTEAEDEFFVTYRVSASSLLLLKWWGLVAVSHKLKQHQYNCLVEFKCFVAFKCNWFCI